MRTPALTSRLGAEALGTFWLVFGGCGSAIFSAKYLAPNVVTGQAVQLGIGFLGVALAFGLTVLTMAYAVGHVSGAHFNPAVTIGVAVAKRFPWRDVPAYLVAQVVGGLVAGLALWGIARGVSGLRRHRQPRRQRLRRPLPRRLHARRGAVRRGDPHRLLPLRHPRRDRRPGPDRASPRSRSASR